ncbi:MAG: ABC transporter ATP-binding protein [bacterium]
MTAPGGSGAALVVRGLTKRYPRVLALDSVDWEVRAGEVHALVGENGAGKSTLARIVYGAAAPDGGTLELFGAPYAPRGPRDAVAAGVGLVHQHFMLVDTLTVWQNAVLGREPSRGGWIDGARARRELAEISRRFGLTLDPDARVADLSVGERQRLEIVKVLMRGARLLILDEPTAVLAPAEAEAMYATVGRLAAEGATVIVVTHRLAEVRRHADRATVLRRGAKIDTVDAKATDERELARLVVGRDPAPPRARAAREPGPVVLAVRDAREVRVGGTSRLRGVSLDVRAGEIVGIAGVEGNGQRELMEIVAGLVPFTGDVEIGGESVHRASPRAIRRLGVAHVPEDRLGAGVIPAMNVAENLLLGHEERFARAGTFDRGAIAAHARERIEAFDVRPADPDLALETLSGGNQQKVVLARETEDGPRLLLAAHPTRGVDVGAAESVHAALLAFRDAGGAVLLVSADLSEVRALADRVLVIYDGAIAAEYPRAEADEERLGLAMTGGRA